MAVLASAILQHATHPPGEGRATDSKVLYTFNSFSGQMPSMMYKLLDVLFEGRVHPARAVLKGGPHCIRQASYCSDRLHLQKLLFESVCYCLEVDVQHGDFGY